ncbi:MAG: hypothetical protein KDC45_11980 [Bacteroidetes bacterium]|nr:hypothetical protein [Bacteroidota bacterium]
MPSVSSFLIRTALVHLVLGFTIGAILLVGKAVHHVPFQYLPIHIELLLVGFVIQLTLGVAFWMFPRLTTITDRGRTKPIFAAYAVLNVGILCCCLSVFELPLLLGFGRAMEVVAMVAFVLNLWPRIYAFGRY